MEKAESTLPMDLRRDEERTRELWERFGQVAPPPPSTLMVVNRPQPMRRHDGSIVLCVLYAFGPEDIKASSPGNIALREELAKDGSAESIEVMIIIMRGMCVGWGVAEIALSLFAVTLGLKICRYFIPVEY